jgi:SAM-dependent methyltransferase
MNASVLAEGLHPYLLEPIPTERERLALQAAMWEPATERLFDALGSIDGWTCLDLGCGAPGVLGTLARRVGTSGRVIGIDNDRVLLEHAEVWARRERLTRVALRHGDAYATGLPDGAFDLVHARFMFAPLGRADALLAEMHRLVRPGGIVVIQEPDASAWQCSPPSREFSALVAAIVRVFALGGGDFDCGPRMHAGLRAAGYADLGVRAEALALPGAHPYARLPLLFAESLGPKLVALLGHAAFDELRAGCAAACAHPDARVTSFVVQQSWGRKPVPLAR